jgi:hypothetical protein
MRALTRAALIVAGASALAACDPYYWGGDPGHYPAPGQPGGYPPPGGPGPGYPGPGYTPRPGEWVDTVGCVVPGVEHQCRILQSADGRRWNITGAQPAPPPLGEWAVRVRGRVAVDAMGYCQEGMILSEVRWEYANIRCREGRLQGY